MFKLVLKKFKSATLFEKLLLIIGLAIGVIGFHLINSVYKSNPLVNWSLLTAVFLWFMLIFMVILTDSSESIKEELSVIIREHIVETKLLKEELKLLRKDISLRSKKK